MLLKRLSPSLPASVYLTFLMPTSWQTYAVAMQESEGVEAQEVAYQHIIQNIQDFQALSRYHGLRAALSMLTNQVISVYYLLRDDVNLPILHAAYAFNTLTSIPSL